MLQQELSALPPALALVPASMSIITMMIVVLHIVVNAEDMVALEQPRHWFLVQIQKLLRLLRNKK